MPYGNEADVFEIDPVTSHVRPATSLANPTLIIVEATPSLSRAVSEICAFLHVSIIRVSNARDLAEQLETIHPIAILHEATDIDCAVYDLLMLIAGHDRGLPVMIVRPDTPQHKSAVDAAQRLWQLEDITHSTRRPGIRELIDFLFRAGKRFGRTRFMPI